MKSFVGYLSMLSVGLIAAVVASNGQITSGAFDGLSGMQSADVAGAGGEEASGKFTLDYASLILGLAIGIIIANLAAIPWAEIPKRIARWLVANQDNFGYVVLTLGLAGVLLYY